ncbi:MAG: exonuclease domain-containing protein [Oscillospiraceae bacterium]|nr:exonuclease domain-containing protein [Oscillospiraceae bacterium]
MKYIILDLEWDSAYHKKHKRFINQILQIGAVKLDSNFDILDSFEVNIKSSFSKKVSNRFATLTGITTEIMQDGISFEEAVNRYNDWVGTDTVTMTWSNSDLFTILENEEFLLGGKRSLKIEKYLDLQKFIQGEMRLQGYDLKNQISLSGAAEILGISLENFDLHTAKDDSLLATAMLKKCYNKKRFEELVQDTQDGVFYRRLTFKPYSITDINDKCIDKKVLKFACENCKTTAYRLTEWKYRNRWFSAKFVCKKCKKEFTGRVMVKKTFDSVIIRKKILKPELETEKKTNVVQSMPEKL